ncbi:MAG: ABC transporter permease [Candidatus Omnitrophica bacterium]|nr:ABC transporter permease [Candidatus Omnitrophota bacterium]
MKKENLSYIQNLIIKLGDNVCFFGEVFFNILRGRVRVIEVLKQIYEQGLQSVGIVIMVSLASGAVLALQGHVVLSRFGAKEYIASMVALSLVRELSPVFTALIFSGKAGARITAELGSMSVNDQFLATRAMGVDPIEYLIVPRMLGCFLVLPILTVISEVAGIAGGYFIGVYEAKISSVFYLNQTLKSIRIVDFLSGFSKVFFFSVIIGWICAYQGYNTKGGSLGVGKYTTQAVAYSYMLVIIFNAILTKIILSIWG